MSRVGAPSRVSSRRGCRHRPRGGTLAAGLHARTKADCARTYSSARPTATHPTSLGPSPTASAKSASLRRRFAAKKVLLKPNLVETARGEPHVNTHPAVIVAAVEVFRRLDAAEVFVAEGQGASSG